MLTPQRRKVLVSLKKKKKDLAYASNSTSTPKFKLLLPVRYFSQQTLFYLATVY